jgi:membrane protein DedA with SNARE-associated domain
MGLPLPGETILVMASLHAGHRGETIVPVIAAAVAGAIIGDNIGSYLGRELGFRFLLRLRCLAAFLAGVNQLPWPRFLVANAAGAVVWAPLWTGRVLLW